MPDLPTGTITFLFTDIEGSTKLWEEHPDTMRLALARHDELLRQAIESNGGVVFKTIGDAFCAAFPTAPQALQAARMAQQGLQRHQEEIISDLTLKVRMALHAGAAEQRDGDYFGPPLNRVARLLAVGHGGQVLLSQIVHDLLPNTTSLKDMGLHRLKDLRQPEHIWQLASPGLASEFPPLRSLSLYSNNLPLQLTSFIGRDKESLEVKSLLATRRLLTITGSGGCGKTRLGLQVAADVLENYPDGIWLVELAPLPDPFLVPQTLADVLGIREATGEPITRTLLSACKDKQMLLVLDNCEHVLETAAHLVDLILKSCPKVSILITSREALGIAGEHAYRIPSLSTPNTQSPQTPESLLEYESIRLFIERAMAVKTGFVVTRQNAPALASICHRLDGIPLAIELAAARTRSIPIEELEKRLDDRFRILTGGSRTALARQQTLRATVAWSYDLLEENQAALLARLSVFVGGWTLEACEQVCTREGVEAWEVLDLLTALVDKSLVVYEEREENARYRLLETIRQYARDRLMESGAADMYRSQHRDYYLALAEEGKTKLNGPEQGPWLDRLETEHDNLRMALNFCMEEPEGIAQGMQLTGALFSFWSKRGHFSEGREKAAVVLNRSDAQEQTEARARVLNGAGLLARLQSDYEQAGALFEQSLAIRRELGDRRLIAGSLNDLGTVAQLQGNMEEARALYGEALAINREIGNRLWESMNLNNLGELARQQGDYTTAQAMYEQNLRLRQELGDRFGISVSLNNLGLVARGQGNYERARSLIEEALAIQNELGNKQGIALCLGNLGNVARNQKDYKTARLLYEESLALRRELKDIQGVAACLLNLGNMALDQGDCTAAQTYLVDCVTLCREFSLKDNTAIVLEGFARMNLHKQPERAAQLYGAALTLRETIRFPLPPSEQEEYDRNLADLEALLGINIFPVAFAAGQAMSFEQAIEYALEEKHVTPM